MFYGHRQNFPSRGLEEKKVKRRMERGDKERFLGIDFFANEKSLKITF